MSFISKRYFSSVPARRANQSNWATDEITTIGRGSIKLKNKTCSFTITNTYCASLCRTQSVWPGRCFLLPLMPDINKLEPVNVDHIQSCSFYNQKITYQTLKGEIWKFPKNQFDKTIWKIYKKYNIHWGWFLCMIWSNNNCSIWHWKMTTKQHGANPSLSLTRLNSLRWQFRIRSVKLRSWLINFSNDQPTWYQVYGSLCNSENTSQ